MCKYMYIYVYIYIYVYMYIYIYICILWDCHILPYMLSRSSGFVPGLPLVEVKNPQGVAVRLDGAAPDFRCLTRARRFGTPKLS